MRSLIFVVLVGCGGGSKSAPPPVSNQPPTTEPKPVTTSITRPACSDNLDTADTQCLISTMEYYVTSMCACPDKACATSTNEDMAKWGIELAKRPGVKDQKPNGDLAKKSADIMNKYVDCMTKLMSDGVPAPDPCGGGADPCGG